LKKDIYNYKHNHFSPDGYQESYKSYIKSNIIFGVAFFVLLLFLLNKTFLTYQKREELRTLIWASWKGLLVLLREVGVSHIYWLLLTKSISLKMSVTITSVKTDLQLHQILELQKINLPRSLSVAEIKKEGFVTVDHSFDILQQMNTPYPHIIAIDNDAVIGYALVMLSSIKDEIEILKPMFEKINTLSYNNAPLSSCKYFVIGQVCVAKAYRGQGVFYKMYDQMKSIMRQDFNLIITEVSAHNTRSLKAHARQGFINILSFKAPDGHPWEILLWDLTN